MTVNENNLLKKTYYQANKINLNINLDIEDEASFFYMDILRNAEVEVATLQSQKCICVDPKCYSLYYEACDKCEGTGFINIFSNKVICNKCKGKKKITIHKCSICLNKGYYLASKKIKVQLRDSLIKNDIIKIENKGLESLDNQGDLYLKVKISDIDRYDIKNLDIYDKLIIFYSEDEVKKKLSKTVLTPQGYKKVFPTNQLEYEVIKLENCGLSDSKNKGDYYVSLKKELPPIKGEDLYSNIILNSEDYKFYLSNLELYSNEKLLTPYYFKPLNDDNFIYVELDKVSSYQLVKLPSLGHKGFNGGSNGDLYLKVFLGENFYFVDNYLYDLNISFNKSEIVSGKKNILIGKEKVNFDFNKNLTQVKHLSVGNYGLINQDKSLDVLKVRVNPFNYENYFISIVVNKLNKVIYIDDYKYYFNETVKIYYSEENLLNYLKIDLSRFSKNKINKAKDKDGNIIIFTILSKEESGKHGGN